MGYSGQTLQIPCDSGGFVYSPETKNLAPNSFVFGSKNIDLNENGRVKRGGTSKINSTAIVDAPRIMGLYDFVLNNTSYQVFLTSFGDLYKDTTTIIKSGMGASRYPSFEVFGGSLFVADGKTIPQVWDGISSSTTDIDHPAVDWNGDDYPFQFMSHGRGASRRLWALMGNSVYYSALGSGGDFSGTGSGVITIETGDAIGLTCGVEWGDRLIVFSRKRAFIIDDTSDDATAWGYSPAQWTGGAAHWRLIVKTPNDVVVMSNDGDVYSLSSVQSYGDYKRASLARPAFIDSYVREQTSLSQIEHFHSVYDEKLQAIRFFVMSQSSGTNNTCLLYFTDRQPLEAWSIHGGENHPSGYDASCSVVVQQSLGRKTIFTGDYSGFIWKLDQEPFNDDGEAYEFILKTPELNFGDPRSKKHYARYCLSCFSASDDVFSILSENEDGDSNDASVEIYCGGLTIPFVLPETIEIQKSDDVFTEIGIKGRSLIATVRHSTLNKKFRLLSFSVDLKTIGSQPS